MLICEAWQEMHQAQNVLKTAMEAEEFEMDSIFQAADQFRFCIQLAYEKDAEVEAIASGHLGRIFYKVLHKKEKALEQYKDSIRICETLKPKTFT